MECNDFVGMECLTISKWTACLFVYAQRPDITIYMYRNIDGIRIQNNNNITNKFSYYKKCAKMMTQ